MTNTASSLDVLAPLNGAAAAFGALSRSFGPVVAGNMLGWGLSVGYVVVPYFMLAAVATGGAAFTFWLKDKRDDDDDDDNNDDD